MINYDPKNKKQSPQKKGNTLETDAPNEHEIAPTVSTDAGEQTVEKVPRTVQEDHGAAKRVTNPGPEGDS